MSLGERFRAAREQRGQTLSEVAEHLHIRSVYLAAIEDENWNAIGAAVYAKGFLRTYARYLGLDAEEAVREFNAVHPMSEPPAAQAAPSRQREPGGGLRALLWAAGVVALGLIAFLVYVYFEPPSPASVAGSPSTLSSSAAPVRSPLGGTGSPAASASASPLPSTSPSPSSASPAQAGVRTLAIRLTQPSWLRVTIDGNVKIEGTFPAGTDKTFHGGTALVRVGNAGGVDITVDGKQQGKLGGDGDVIEKSYTL